jgi:hypothetical protein
MVTLDQRSLTDERRGDSKLEEDRKMRSKLGCLLAVLLALPALAHADPLRLAPSLRLQLQMADAGAAAAPSAEEIDAAIAKRRARLTLHQVLGIGTEVVGLGALTVSILDDRDRFGGGARTGNLKTAELGLDIGAEALTIGTYLFAATAGRPFDKEKIVDSNSIHQGLMYGAAFLQLAKIALSVALFNAQGPAGNQALVTAHRVAMYGAPVLFLAGAVSQVF